MRLINWLLLAALLHAAPTLAANNPRVKITTSEGDIVLELNADKAPASVANFLSYVRSGFYNATIFHRVIKNFMIQGGGFTADFKQKSTQAAIKNEADNGLKNLRGSIAMARTGDPHSATAQFFINTVDNDFLNHRDKSIQGWGYTVFGQVTSGMDVVDRISATATGAAGPFRQDVPKTTITINAMTILE